MEALLKTRLIENWENCNFSRCGRTDKGVSAFRQTAAMNVRWKKINKIFFNFFHVSDRVAQVKKVFSGRTIQRKIKNWIFPKKMRNWRISRCWMAFCRRVFGFLGEFLMIIDLLMEDNDKIVQMGASVTGIQCKIRLQ